MMNLRSLALTLIPCALSACVATEPVGGSPGTDSAGESSSGGSAPTTDASASASATSTTTSSTTAETDSSTTTGSTDSEGTGTDSEGTGTGTDSGSSDSSTGGLFVPCEERGVADCDDGETIVDPDSDIEFSCRWFGAVMHLPADSCEPVAPDGVCLPQPLGGEEGCAPRPTCDGAGTDGVFYRELEDGTVDVVPDEGCGFNEPAGFTRCGWGEDFENPTETVTDGPAACDCAC